VFIYRGAVVIDGVIIVVECEGPLRII
jgi:hypothetical protein